MAKSTLKVDDLLAMRTRAELRAALSDGGGRLSLSDAQRVASHAEALEPVTWSLRLGIIHTYTSEALDPWLSLAALLQGLRLHAYHAPYGLSLQETEPASGLVRHRPDVTLLMLRREDLHPGLGEPLVRLSPARASALRHEVVERLGAIVGAFRAKPVGQIVLTVLPSLLSPGLGLYDAHAERSESAWWASLKADIARFLRESIHSSLFLDLDDLVQEVGRKQFFDPRFWYAARFPFTPTAAWEFARRVVAVGAVLALPRAKVIVVDADNTLWGGVIGEDGLHGIALGPEYPGSAYRDFQRRLLDYQQRGFILALCSKNNPEDLEQVLAEHPHEVLRDEHFAARRVNWLPKPDNLLSLAEELNVGLESFIVVDDSAHECAAVRQRFPEVEVVQTPSRPIEVPMCLDQVARLEVLSLTPEDLAKTELYAQERRRRASRQTVERAGVDVRDYLLSLKMTMRIGLDDADQVMRLSQLTQKTNQFNLSTRRYDEHQMQRFLRDPQWLVAHYSLADVFGDSGVVGLALMHKVAPQIVELDTFLMSCRVIGRGAESAFLNALLGFVADRGVHEILADYIPTPKNVLVQTFLPDHGFEQCGEGRYRRDLREKPPQPGSDVAIAVEFVSGPKVVDWATVDSARV
jgi:FkbH-like protein